MMDIKLYQNAADNWVIAVPNPEERGWETKVAEFNMECAEGPARVAMFRSAAFAFFSMVKDLNYLGQVDSYNRADKAEMIRNVIEVATTEFGVTAELISADNKAALTLHELFHELVALRKS